MSDADILLPEQPRKHSLRVTGNARADIEAGWDYFAGREGVEIADRWQEGLEEAFATLSVFPERCPVIAEADRFTPPSVRQHLYYRTHSGPAYRILFRIYDDPAEMPIVRILAVRHASRAAITRSEARDIDDSAQNT